MPTSPLADRRTPELRMYGRITAWCIGESIVLKNLLTTLEDRFGLTTFHVYPEVVHCPYVTEHGDVTGDVFYFDFGAVVCWGLTAAEEREAVIHIGGASVELPLPELEVEVDEFDFMFEKDAKPAIQNDRIRLNASGAADPKLKLAVSHAVAQSTRLSVCEERVMQIVMETRALPEQLSETGAVTMSEDRIAQLIGEVFLQKSSVNLLTTVLDTPEFFWGQPDHLQALYKAVCNYLELDERVTVLNSRYETLQEMLDMCRNHQSHAFSVRLEWAVIGLLVLEVILGLFQTASILYGWHGKADALQCVPAVAES